ncbi:helix-turn-helix domain-containing protein [Paenibacillus tyrfis]|uniref:helix-turn-helix domain-containing protein n=1 Tax=Paenibacillus tyrfis TaxID=1501230 RepID=UPI00209CE8B9|nr:helix-turn-helix domain-containing protein [Paenibacillus tyrfis]MCP1311586.1 helix-turn-helix domain-containing protein [Paenibacillus tyrfis]
MEMIWLFNLLVVDDEKFAVKGITQGIDWSDLPIRQIYEAYCAEEAKHILMTHNIDVLISDIEMPDANGLKLQEWVKEHSPFTETVFLTGHANFDYAQKAIQLGSFNYLLKPVDHSQLKEIVAKAIHKIQSEQELLDFNKTYETYYKHWLNQLPILVERFWQDLLGGKIPSTQERLQTAFEMYSIPLNAQSLIIPVLISVEQWKEDLNARDEEIMGYALRKAGAEMILQDNPGCVILDHNGFNLVLFYVQDSTPVSMELDNRCQDYIQACNRFFHCNLSCYIGEKTPVTEINQVVGTLLRMERDNVMKVNCVLHQLQLSHEVSGATLPSVASINDWFLLYELGKLDELLMRIDELTDRMQQGAARSETLQALCYGLIHMVYHVGHKKGLSIQNMFPHDELQDTAAATRSLKQLRSWAIRVVSTGIKYMSRHHQDISAVVAKVQKFISDHLHEELNREDIANYVHLNPAYLSRLFKKETGLSLSEYMLKVRMDKAQKLLIESDRKISSVAEVTGYSHFSHFAKMFKRVTGISPQEYRKKFQINKS